MPSSLTVYDLQQNLTQNMNKTITLNGWVRSVRASNATGFIHLHDGTFFPGVQIVFAEALKNFSTITKVSIGSALQITGKVVESPASGQAYEISAEKITILGEAEADFPLQKKRHGFEFLRTIAPLRPRTNTFQAVFRLRSKLAQAVHTYFQDRNFIYLHAPIITCNDCEGAGEMFTVTTLDLEKQKGRPDFSADFFGNQAGLTVSGQLNAEAFAHAFQNVYTFGPTFRAENSNTSRHAAEFWMIEPEIAFADLGDNIDLAEDLIRYLIKYLLAEIPAEMEFFNQHIDQGLIERLKHVGTADFERLTYTKAIELLENSAEKFEFPVSWGVDLQSEHEQWLCKKIGRPVTVTDYPKDIKAFYMRLNEDNKTVAAMDVLVPGIGEIVGGSQREERLDFLTKRMKEMDIPQAGLEWYLDLRRFGGVTHSGFGAGFERMVMYFSGMENIRDVIPFPRTPKNAKF